ncbi:MAG: T9SS type A sorting domain-containing protein [Bacteroidales bacterium]|nr:T9SS type A sorting domain-containing protein [Bacteroidales bacterium]
MNHYTNKKSLALLGHSKLKGALRHTLLIIGMVLMSLGAFAQNMSPVPEGLKMEKKWVSDDPTGRTGNILVEAFVTGHSVAQHVPTDIVLVLDVSGSMDDEIGETDEYIEQPERAYSFSSFFNSGSGGATNYYILYEGQYRQITAERTGGYGNRRYNLHFSVGGATYYLYGTGVQNTNPNVQGNTTTIWTGVLYRYGRQTKMEALHTSVGLFVDIIANDAITYNVEHRISIVKYAMNSWGTGSNASTITELNEFDNNGYNHTQVVVHRRNPVTDAEEIKTIVNNLRAAGATASDYGMNKARYVLASIPAAEFEQRNKVVVMFTDGAPTHGSTFNQTVATNTISYAHDLKHSWTNGGNTYQFDAPVFSVGVFDNETTQIRTYMNYVSSNYPDATSYTNGGTATPGAEFYFKAESAGSLSDIFEAIAGASGAMSLPASAIVQDMVSPNFQMPEGATGTVIAYAPKCTDYNEETGEYSWESLNDAGTLTIGTITVDGEQVSGVVTGGGENKLPANFVTVNGKTIQMSGFNFSHHWCGWIEDDEGHKTINGRKIVIKIPVEVQGGTWGDGIQTNDPAHSYIQVGDTYYGPFNNLTTNVMGDVWTEVVVTEPTNFDPMNIDSPEDLAWFISRVNGRIHYNDHDGQSTNNVASNTSLSGRLTADIDMSAHNWVPIGAGYQCNANNEYIYDANGKKIKLAYQGEFDGNGHVITGLKNNADKWYKVAEGQDNEVVVYPGMFSNVGANGKVHDVFILDADFRGKAHEIPGKGFFVHHGLLADTLTGGQIYNCEAAGRMTCNNDNDNDVNLVYGGLVGLNNGGTIYNAMAMAELTGYAMGGAVGENRSGSFSNGFTNGVYKYLGETGTNAKAVGGIAGTNSGTINNCYVRFERLTNENLNKATFGMLVGSGSAATNSYIPQIVTWSRPSATSITTQVNLNNTVPTTATTPAGNPTDSYTLSVNKTYYNMFTNDNMTGGTWGTLGSFNVYNNGTPLVDKLEANKGNGASWKRTTAGGYSADAGNINGDFPVLQLPGYTCLASTDGITIDYAKNLSDMLHRHNSGALNENTSLDSHPADENKNFYKPTDHPAINGGTINLFANDDNRSTAKAAKEQSTDDNVVVYIDENISLLQDADGTIEAYTGQTLQAYNNTGLLAGERWHNISSSLSNSEFGWGYGDEGKVPSALSDGWDAWAAAHPKANGDPRDAVDPCFWNLNNHDEDQAFYPIDLSSYHRGDFYCFYEPEYHWINFRRNSSSHWHMDDPENDITYTNEDHFLPGKGYLVTIDMSTYWSGYGREAQFVQNRGTLNNGNVPINVTCTEGIGWTGRQGYNLLGNPYQSYLDFDAFVSGNADLLGNSTYANTYAVYVPEEDAWLQYLAGSSPEGSVSDRYINMHQGFFIQVNGGGTATFTNDMRTNQKGNGFRGNENHYPLVNFTLTDDEGNKDIAVLEVSRPENDGAKKIFVSTSKGRLSLRHDNEDFAILFRDMQSGSQPLYFEAKEDGTFTLSWNTANANFSSLTLVDNLTGVKYDMLANDHYTFQGNASDYRSRFKVVIGRFTGIDEEDGPSTGSGTFAFYDGSDWVVNGQGQLTVTDMTGRTVYSSNLTNDQNRVSLNGVANGIYLMRVANGQNVNVQKIIIK